MSVVLLQQQHLPLKITLHKMVVSKKHGFKCLLKVFPNRR